jgi:GNAT superfamily N-acetyltransferase
MPLVLEPRWVGRRVSLRRVVERAPDGRLLQSDVVGDLVGLDAQTAVVAGRSGLIEVPIALITAARPVPPSTAEQLALETVIARGWSAAETEELDGWLLRADHGFTKRANSVLPLRQMRLPLDEALARATDWYAARELPLLFQVPTDARRLLDAALGERGWPAEALVHVLAQRLDGPPPNPGHPVELDPEPDDAWLTLFRNGAARNPTGRALLTRHREVCFASARRDGQTVAIGRGTVDDGWLGLTAMAVDPAHRRQGLARAVTGALWAWGAGRGATHSHLEVEDVNDAAAQLYARLGYWRHHDYHYRRPNDPAAGDAPPEDGAWAQ